MHTIATLAFYPYDVKTPKRTARLTLTPPPGGKGGGEFDLSAGLAAEAILLIAGIAEQGACTADYTKEDAA